MRVLRNRYRQRLERFLGIAGIFHDQRDVLYFKRLSEMDLEKRKADRFTREQQGNWPPAWPVVIVDSMNVPSPDTMRDAIVLMHQNASKMHQPTQNRAYRRRQAALRRAK